MKKQAQPINHGNLINRIMGNNATEPKRGEFYLAFDTAWFSAFYTSKGQWIYNGKEITPTHWMELPNDPE